MPCWPKAPRVLLLTITFSLAGLGCMEPLQNGGVMIYGDPSERVAALCRFRHRDATSDVCAPSGADLANTEETPSPEEEKTPLRGN